MAEYESSMFYENQSDYDMEMSGMHNETTNLQSPPKFNNIYMIKTIGYSLMFVISLIGNSATIIQMLRRRRRKSTINTLILHLAIADLVVTFFYIMTDAIWNYTVQWYGGDFLCKLTKYLQVFGLYSSTYMVVIISLDRCLAILDPMSRNRAPRRVKIMVTVAWILSAVFSLPQTYIFRVHQGPFKETFVQCVTYGAYPVEWLEPLYSFMSMLLLFIIPLVTMITAYMLIFCTIAKKSKDLQRETESANTEMLSQGPVRGQLFRKAKVKSLQMTALIVVAFIICWTPYYVLFFMFVFFDTDQIDQKSVVWINFFGMSNSLVNPMIYGAFHVCKRNKRSTSCVKFGAGAGTSREGALHHYYNGGPPAARDNAAAGDTGTGGVAANTTGTGALPGRGSSGTSSRTYHKCCLGHNDPFQRNPHCCDNQRSLLMHACHPEKL